MNRKDDHLWQVVAWLVFLTVIIIVTIATRAKGAEFTTSPEGGNWPKPPKAILFHKGDSLPAEGTIFSFENEAAKVWYEYKQGKENEKLKKIIYADGPDGPVRLTPYSPQCDGQDVADQASERIPTTTHTGIVNTRFQWVPGYLDYARGAADIARRIAKPIVAWIRKKIAARKTHGF